MYTHRLTYPGFIVLHKEDKVVKLDASSTSKDLESVSESLSLVQEQFTELLLLLLREITVHHSQQLSEWGGGGGVGGERERE